MSTVLLDINAIAKARCSIVLRVTGVRRFRFKLRLATLLIGIAIWISPVPIALEFEDEART